MSSISTPVATQTIIIPNDVPVYKIMDERGFFADNDILYPQGTVVKWSDEPNTQMLPMNEMARTKLQAYIDKLEKLGRDAAEKLGVPYEGLDTARDIALQLAHMENTHKNGAIEVNDERPIMGVKKKGRSAKVAEITPEAISEVADLSRKG